MSLQQWPPHLQKTFGTALAVSVLALLWTVVTRRLPVLTTVAAVGFWIHFVWLWWQQGRANRKAP
jgi:hypothetical protein